MDDLIRTILSTKRAHSSKGELDFLAWLRERLVPHKPITLAEGCVAVVIGDKPKTLFSCHIDTCHSTVESDGSKQELFFDEAFGHLFTKGSGCLGADDGAGIYIMLRMIEENVPGGYIFHRGEERGCIGSNAVLRSNSVWLKQFSACVAFDRPGNDEVIITQGNQQCGSETYGAALAKELNKEGLKFATSHRGVVTDSKVYRYIIPECINIGVGYGNQHGPQEYQDWEHLQALTAVVVDVQWDKLPVTRVCPAVPSLYVPAKSFADGPTGFGIPLRKKSKKKSANVSQSPESLEDMDMAELEGFLATPMAVEAVVDLLCQLQAERGRVLRLQRLLGL